ncbi:N-acetyltransferase [Arenibacter sp. H213]|uniref:GNAT family N-acetyltransferase n=1 Tax=Arenibacter antarcticus TaxID=2040469 RepID=A0ABW5VB59_9FLAO|nr:GNAT family N-acetyltransferase [Arenibacter sp. H213]MCM4169600.1 N-acetyltransferase [Arenibacter sp. H213]
MERISLSSISDPYFLEAWQLYETSFPKEERRTLAVQEKIMNYKAYNFDLILSEDLVVGFLLWWGFEDVVFVEHFATSPELRGQGYGKKILQGFIKGEGRPVILEVELPEPGIKLRRIEFYKRLGFTLNTHHYVQPPMQKACGAIPLYLMSYPEEFTEESVAHFVTNYHPLIYDQTLL